MGNGERERKGKGREGKEKERGGKGKEGRKEKGEREGSSSVSQPRASCCALYLRGNVPPSLFPFKKTTITSQRSPLAPFDAPGQGRHFAKIRSTKEFGWQVN